MAYTAIDNPELYFQTKNYTGTGSSNAITLDGDENMQPDWVWIKCRDDSHNHQVFDSVRGVHKRMRTDTTGAETESSESLKSFDSDGFTVGTQANVNAAASGDNSFVAWNWLAGGSASSNSDGDITSSISANTTAGFSVVSYTGSGTIGDTVGHGLGVKPAMIITKNRDSTAQWVVWHQGGTSTKNTDLATNNAEYDSGASGWQQGINGVPTTSVLTFTAGSHGNTNVMDSSDKYVSYVFTEKKGYSKFGKYVGASATDGTFIYLGFRPAFFMAKAIGRDENWYIFDNKRQGYNVDNDQLYPDVSNTEATTDYLDILSNGVKYRYNSVGLNGAGEEYIYMAFAENPVVNSKGVPGNAR